MMSANRMLAGVFGATYVVVGLAGFAVTSGLDFMAREGDQLIVFEVNPLHNVVHLAIGALLLAAAAAGLRASRTMNAVIGVSYLATGLLGLWLVGDQEMNFLAINDADNILHFASAALLLAVAIWGDRSTARHSDTTQTERPRQMV